MRISITKLILFGLIGVFFAQMIFYYPNLGETVATHFDAVGQPNGLMPKRVFMTFEIALLLLLVSEALLIPLIIEKVPVRFLSIPNREYWLADERRAETFSSIRSFFEVLGVATVTFFIVVNQLVFRANINRENLQVWVFLTIFTVFVVTMSVWLLKFVRRFRIPKRVQ
ncbi:MAG: DUF1648 domain-containing protein [Acidobacteria bacterium]|nr:DUF1648 domain-containing protein [Acidobacteriota bacterium]MBK8811041.1 DUF1648 domain-containing protein [Acidobacteriota bacterium]